MRREYFKYFFLTGCLLLVTFPAHAQEVVHALCGTARSIDSTNKTITVVTDSGTSALFKESTKPEVHLDFDKRIRADTTAADAFTKNEARVIVYYFGNGDNTDSGCIPGSGYWAIRGQQRKSRQIRST